MGRFGPVESLYVRSDVNNQRRFGTVKYGLSVFEKFNKLMARNAYDQGSLIYHFIYRFSIPGAGGGVSSVISNCCNPWISGFLGG